MRQANDPVPARAAKPVCIQLIFFVRSWGSESNLHSAILQRFGVKVPKIFPTYRLGVIGMRKVGKGQVRERLDVFLLFTDIPKLMGNSNPGIQVKEKLHYGTAAFVFKIQ